MTRDEIYQDIRNTFGVLPEFFTHLPDATIELDWQTFKAFQLSETTLPSKYKELMGLGIASALQCPFCEFYHREAAKFFGATEEELNETARVALQTGGWSSFIAASGESLEQFKQEIRTALVHLQAQQEQRKAA